MSSDTPDLLLTDKTILAETMIELRGARSASRCAYDADITPASWRGWELGRNSPQPFQFPKILKGLGCTSEEFDRTIWQRMTRRLVERGIEVFEYSEYLQEPPEGLRQKLSQVLKTYANMLYGAALQIEKIHQELAERD